MSHYETLGVSENASPEEIRKAFKRLTLQCHPDRDHSESAKARFIAIKAAHQILSDAISRRRYDESLKQPTYASKEQQQADELEESMEISSSYNPFSSSSGMNAAPRKDTPPPLDIFDSIDITLTDLYTGSTRWLEVKRKIRCPEPSCSTHCHHCQGRRWIEQKKKLKLEISASHEPPSEYRFPGDGDEAIDSRLPPGDVIIRPNIIPHSMYKRQGVHLFFDKQISVQELSCGFLFELPPLDKREWKFSLLDQVAILGGHYVARGFGMLSGTGLQRGHLIINISLRLPRRLFMLKEDWIAAWPELNRDEYSNFAKPLELLSESEYQHLIKN